MSVRLIKTDCLMLEASAPVLPAQLVDATHALNLSAGVSKFNVFRGRSLRRLATLSNSACE